MSDHRSDKFHYSLLTRKIDRLLFSNFKINLLSGSKTRFVVYISCDLQQDAAKLPIYGEKFEILLRNFNCTQIKHLQKYFVWTNKLQFLAEPKHASINDAKKIPNILNVFGEHKQDLVFTILYETNIITETFEKRQFIEKQIVLITVWSVRLQVRFLPKKQFKSVGPKFFS